MFIDENIPSSYNRIAEISDNYIVLVRENKLNDNTDYDAYIQFFSPSTEVLHITNYRITNGDSYTYDYHYTNNQYYSYIDYMTLDFSKNTYALGNTSTSFFDRHDFWSIGLVVALLLALVILIVNLATSLVHRGGIFHG